MGAGGNVCRVRAASPVLVAQHFTTCRPLGECCCCFCLFLGSNSSITEEFVHLLVLGAFVEEPLGKEGKVLPTGGAALNSASLQLGSAGVLAWLKIAFL